MKKVIDHRYARLDSTPIYDKMNGKLLGHLPSGTWMGVTAKSDGWLNVISAEIDGWVATGDTIKGEDLKLSIVIPKILSPQVMNYALSA